MINSKYPGAATCCGAWVESDISKKQNIIIIIIIIIIILRGYSIEWQTARLSVFELSR